MEGKILTGNGQIYFAIVHTLADIPETSEMEMIYLFDAPPINLTYPAYYTEVFPLALEKLVKS